MTPEYSFIRMDRGDAPIGDCMLILVAGTHDEKERSKLDTSKKQALKVDTAADDFKTSGVCMCRSPGVNAGEDLELFNIPSVVIRVAGKLPILENFSAPEID